jgi:hypothetical protein
MQVDKSISVVCAGNTKRCHTHHTTAIRKTKDTLNNMLCRCVSPRAYGMLPKHIQHVCFKNVRWHTPTVRVE